MIDPTKNNFTRPLSTKQILDELENFGDDCYRALSILKDKDLELHLKKEPKSCFADNYFGIGLKAWQADTDIQPVFNEYQAATCKSLFLKN